METKLEEPKRKKYEVSFGDRGEIRVNSVKLVDGLGFDPEKELFFMVDYGWYWVIPDRVSNGYLTAKSGITRHDVYTAMVEAGGPIRGREFPQKPMWGFKNQRRYFPAGITVEQANLILLKTDFTFKRTMEKNGWCERTKKGNINIGTEFYTLPAEKWEETVRESWNQSREFAFGLVLGSEFSMKSFSSGLVPEKGQEKVHTQLEKYFEHHSMGIFLGTTAYGKTSFSFFAPFRYKGFKEKKVIHYNGHNIFSTKEMARDHSKYSEGTEYSEGVTRIGICSDTRKNLDDYYFGIEYYSSSDPLLQSHIEDLLRRKIRVFFYICRESYKEFSYTYNLAAQSVGIDQKPGQIIDEIQKFTGHKDSKNAAAIHKSCCDTRFGLTATMRDRPPTDKNRDHIYNSDIEHFGEIAAEVGVYQAIKEKRNCPVTFCSVEIREDSSIAKSILNNREISLILGERTEIARGNLLRGCATIIKAIEEDSRESVAAVTSLIQNAKDAVKILTVLQAEGFIPEEYNIILALADQKDKTKKEFEESKKSIIIGTPWIVTGANFPKIDGIVSFYDFANLILPKQWLGRGMRYLPGKTCICYIPIDPESRQVPMLYIVATRTMMDENIRDNIEIPVERDAVLGSRSQVLIGMDNKKDDEIGPKHRLFWDSIYNQVEFGEIGKILENFESVKKYTFEEQREIIRKDPEIWGSETLAKCIDRGDLWRPDWRKFYKNPQGFPEWTDWNDFTGKRFAYEAREKKTSEILDRFNSLLKDFGRIDIALSTCWNEFSQFFTDEFPGFGPQLIGTQILSPKKEIELIYVEEIDQHIYMVDSGNTFSPNTGNRNSKKPKICFGVWLSQNRLDKGEKNLTETAKDFPVGISRESQDLRKSLLEGFILTGNITKKGYSCGEIQRELPHLNLPPKVKFHNRSLERKYSESVSKVIEAHDLAFEDAKSMIASYKYHFEHFQRCEFNTEKWKDYVKTHNSKNRTKLLFLDLKILFFTAVGKGYSSCDDLDIDSKITLMEKLRIDPSGVKNYIFPKGFEVRDAYIKAGTLHPRQGEEHKKSGLLPFWVPDKLKSRWIQESEGQGIKYYFPHVEIKKKRIIDSLKSHVKFLRNSQGVERTHLKGFHLKKYNDENSVLNYQEISSLMGISGTLASLIEQGRNIDIKNYIPNDYVKSNVLSPDQIEFLESYRKWFNFN